MPCQTVLTSVTSERSTIGVPLMASFIISETANSPIIATGNEIPSIRNSVPKVKRGVDVTTSWPMKAASTPSRLAMSPFMSEPWLNVAMTVRPHSAIIRYSLGPSARITGRMSGMHRARNTAPMMPPISAPVADADSARFACPCLVMG
jgi:hypothetical protein